MLTAKEQYRLYLKSKRWRAIRRTRLRMDGWKCVNCGAKKRLQIHHNSYRNLGRRFMSEVRDCVTLCNSCHKERHGIH